MPDGTKDLDGAAPEPVDSATGIKHDKVTFSVEAPKSEPKAAVRLVQVPDGPKLVVCQRCLESWPTHEALAAIVHTEKCGAGLK